MLDLTIIIAALDDEDLMRQQMQRLPALVDPHAVEIVTVDGGSCDETSTLGAELGRVIHCAGNRAARMNAGAREARGETLLFLQPDTLLPLDAWRRIRRVLRQPGVVGGCFRKRGPRGSWLLRLADLLTNLRLALRLTLYGDRAVFVRRQAFLAIGGFDEQRDVFEDVDLGRRLRRIGRLVQVAADVETSPRRTANGTPRALFWRMAVEVGWRLGLDVSPLRRERSR